MALLVVRHAKAAPRSPTGLDFDRPLAPRGHRQARFLSRRLSEAALCPRRVIASPAVRTVQTAREIASALSLEVETMSALWLESPVSAALEIAIEAARDRPEESVAIVSHAPLVGGVIGSLVSGPAWVEPVVRTGECFVLELAGDAAEPGVGAYAIVDQIRGEAEEA